MQIDLHIEGLVNAQPRWQRMLDCLALQLAMPVAMVSLVDGAELTIAQITSEEQGPRAGQRFDLAVNTYCANVVRSGEDLFVQDVQRMPSVEHQNPTAAQGLVHYYGQPIRDDQGRVVGTVCVMDRRPRPESSSVKHFVTMVRDAIEEDIRNCVRVAQYQERRLSALDSLNCVLRAFERTGIGSRASLQALGFTHEEVQHFCALSALGASIRSDEDGKPQGLP
ncbi:GAF domain-containing protein [Roseateles sp. So40a]|uniref:GAF domain-containing protein n=1 Tax=Roseateles sp. So40a TaxID=3400226 RepID=UPI003A879760